MQGEKKKNKKLKILHFVECYLQPTETFIYNFINQSSIGNETCIVAFNILNNDKFPLPENCTLFQLPKCTTSKFERVVESITKSLSGKRKNKLWVDQLHKIIREFKPNVIHCHFGTIGLKYVEYSEKYSSQPPFITSFYGYDASELPKRDILYKKGLTKLWSETKMVLVEGPARSDRLEQLGAPVEKIRLSPIIIDVKKYPVRGTYSRLATQPINFLLIGRFVEKKGFHIFLKTVGKILNQLPPFKITFIGNGPMLKEYKKIINELGYFEDVSFEGIKSLDECMAYMVSADVLVHPSLTASNGDSEGGAPTILLEAQAIGIPIISSLHADIPYVMGYQNYLSKEGDIDSLAHYIMSFLEDLNIEEKITMGKKSVQLKHSMKSSRLYIELLGEFQLDKKK